ncbi:MAG: sigma-54-dependent transcriptional regulator [Candidatus Methylacidiphilales bacterium]
MKLQRILVLDDESAARAVTTELLRDFGYTALAVPNARQAMASIAQEEFDLVISDIHLEESDGMEFLSTLKASHPLLPVIVMTGFGSLDSAMKAIRLGVFEYLLKPIDPDFLKFTLERLEQSLALKAENAYLRHLHSTDGDDAFFSGNSAAMKSLWEAVAKIAQTDATVLIRGESGTGKEVVARTLHQKGRRSANPFIRVNCAAIPSTLLESEFFGHERGAFTGATQRRQGRFELAESGTLLLDEISEIPPELQVKLLRVLQEREFERVGGNQTLHVDVNIIATTNRHLEQEVQNGRFREDLFYRLNVIPLHVPSLRNRGDDIVGLARHFLNHYARKHGKTITPLSPAIEQCLLAYGWPGNVRELQNVVERAVILASPDGILSVSDFPVGDAPLLPTDSNLSQSQCVRSLAELEKEAILQALERCGGNRTRAAEMLGISLRTIRNKIRSYRDKIITNEE